MPTNMKFRLRPKAKRPKN